MEFPSGPWCGMLIAGSPSKKEGEIWNSFIQVHDGVF
jgi:hypothetical protein